MMNNMVDSLLFKQKSLNGFKEKLLADANAGCLIVDKKLTVVAFNQIYLQFHNLYNQSEIEIGHVVHSSNIIAISEAFYAGLQQVLSREIDQISLQIDYLEKDTASYIVSISHLSKQEFDFEGASVIVSKKKITAVMPAMKQNEEFFKQLVETSPSVYLLADAALVFTYASSAIENILGYTACEIIGRNAIELVHPDDKELVRDWLIAIRRQPGKMFTLEYRIQNKSGTYIWIENNARNSLNNESIKSVVMNFRNIQTKRVADDALIQVEQRLSLLLNNTEESFIILNSRLRIVTYNKAAQVRSPFFYRQELQSGLSVLDLIGKDEIPEYISLFENVFKGKEIEKESKFVSPDGSYHIYSHTFRPLLDSDNDIFGVFITSREITERRKLTEEVAIHSERLKTAQKIARLGYFEYDISSNTFFCSEQFYEILEISNELQKWEQIYAYENNVHPEDIEVLKSEIEKSIVQGKDFTLEFRYLTNGTEKVILAIGGTEKNEAGTASKFRITFQDITDSKIAILALQMLESKFKSLFENSIDGVILSKEQGDIIAANPSVCKMLGYLPEELISLKSTDLFDITSTAVQEMFEVSKEDNSAFIGELFIKHKDGHLLPIEITSISMKDGNGVAYLSTIIRDITEKKKIEGEQKALTEELLKNNQDLQQFSFITSHNLRAPVANLLSLLSLYNKQDPADEFNQLLIEKFEEASQQLNQTLNDLVNVLVIKSNTNIPKETVSFTNIYLEVKKNIENLLDEQKGTIEADFSAIDQIQYNRIHIESIFLNMISNAIRYSSPGRKASDKN
jgi:PAS domain S-box-containing protein